MITCYKEKMIEKQQSDKESRISNKNNPLLAVDFHNLYPVALGPLQFNYDASDVEYIVATASFSYQIYEFTSIRSTAS